MVFRKRYLRASFYYRLAIFDHIVKLNANYKNIRYEYSYLILFILSLVDLARSRSEENGFWRRFESSSTQLRLRSSMSLDPVAALSDFICGLNYTSRYNEISF